jgi:hypothetical protein
MPYNRAISIKSRGTMVFRSLLTSIFFGLWIFIPQLTYLDIDVFEYLKFIPWRCPLKFLTGISCPSCGLTRSFLAFFNGNIELAYQYHPLGPTLVVLVAAILTMLSMKDLIQLIGIINPPKSLHEAKTTQLQKNLKI